MSLALDSYHVGDCRGLLRQLDDGSVQTCVTSPPYWGLRDYGVEGQLGLEATPQEYVAELVAVFREVRRVLRDDGTLWLNLGDSYAGSGRGGYIGGSSTLGGSTTAQDQSRVARGSQKAAGKHEGARAGGAIGRAWVPPPPGLKEKDLIGIPWRVALALQDDGWYLRQDNIWNKPNAMPSPVTDRTTRSHEYVFHLSKSASYYYDAVAISEPAVSDKPAGNRVRKNRVDHGGLASHHARQMFSVPWSNVGGRRNRRSVWTLNTAKSKRKKKPDKDHFAVMSPEVASLCVLAGAPVGGVVLDPFGGEGTVAEVAEALGRRWILFDLNPKYARAARRRTAQMGLLARAAS